MSLLWLCFIGALHSVMGNPHGDIIVDIMDGNPTDISKVPYMASLLFLDTIYWCSGSIIHERFILTAAQCIIENHKHTVVVGRTKLDEIGDTYKVNKVFVHQNYSPSSADYDVALMKVSEPIVFKNTVQKIDLPDHNVELGINDILTVNGWGWTETQAVSNNLQTVKVPFVPTSRCQRFYTPSNRTITKRMLCAGSCGEGSCYGDNGGPLVHASGVQVGITSFGKLICGIAPGVYTKVSAVKDWISETIAQNSI